MSELNDLFRKRIGMPENETITFDTLDRLLDLTALAIPFENFCIIEERTSEITRQSVVEKILFRNEGGLCYELNSMLYFFLLENGFDANLIRGVVYKHDAGGYYTIGRTHATILLTHEGQTYLLDTGFGSNLPLKPVPLTGEAVSSRNGEFRIKKEQTEYGDYVLEMKLKHKDTDWRIGYTFDSRKLVTDVVELNEIQTIIARHELSPFNKSPLLTKLTERGNVTLTNSSFTQWMDGVMSKEEIDGERFKKLAKQYFGL
ncbi:arylamine N-acetyltransferase family protein [Brevibacillus sp. 179-C9.3 HS]|uniref:arylamine N-acetyltransferase family protein n=1 Tax=unclassified Brevibacillus TaxID=2684853 RepID=UPI0039A0AF76